MADASLAVSPWHMRIAIAAAVVFPLAVVYLYRVPPEAGALYPRCMFNAATGLHCPGCGTTRSLHSLLHGDVQQALVYNAVSPFLVLGVLIVGVRWWITTVTGRTFRPWRLPAWLIYTLAGVLLAYCILRNLPFAPFDGLAPHRLG